VRSNQLSYKPDRAGTLPQQRSPRQGV